MFFLYYTTFKYSTIKDKYLGIYYYCGIAAVIIYSILTIFINKGYLQIDHSPHGAVTLISDSIDNNLTLPNSDHYCCEGPDCEVKCFLIDGKELAWPLDKDSVTISSFFKERYQTILPGLKITESSEEAQYFAKKPEAMDIKVEHSVHSRKSTKTGTQRTMRGTLMSHNGSLIKEFNSYERADRLSLKDIIDASGMGSLDDISDSPNGNNKSFRRKGCLMLVTIFYHNILSSMLGTTPLSYTYTVERVPYTPHRVEEIIPMVTPSYWNSKVPLNSVTAEERYTNPQHRLLRKRYGVHIKFVQSGAIGRFSLSHLLQCLATSMSLITLITTVGDIIALYLLPQSKYYREVIYGMHEDDIVDHTQSETDLSKSKSE
ncbi:P2X receptor A-like isoform X2 [Bolinopsis microptera]|uniref:P2X receptor A-like isoform X2 n=1 Tax=Bolinopsis microptera TaxID=2820187 RepID=UPI00307A8CBA